MQKPQNQIKNKRAMPEHGNDQFPPVRFPRQLRDYLQEEADERAQSRGRRTMSIAEYIAERRLEWIAAEQEPDEEC